MPILVNNKTYPVVPYKVVIEIEYTASNVNYVGISHKNWGMVEPKNKEVMQIIEAASCLIKPLWCEG